MNLRPPSRIRSAVLVAVCAVALSGCVADQFAAGGMRKHQRPVSPATMALIEQKGMTKESPILLRIYKQEAELEVWKQTAQGRYEFLKKYPICKWSGELGPKIQQGDRQAPEGFYAIRPELMNPHSSYHLSFNLGFPNEFDRAHNRTGAHLMVHGDCSSSGCYAMTDEQISEIFALAREAFDGGQLAFQVQALPFRMTAANMARHRNNPNLAFWRMLKEGSDHFETTRVEPKIDVCNRRYVFNAVPNDPMKPFDPTRPCPAYHVQPDIALALQGRRGAEENDLTALVNRTMPAAPVRTGTDGGSNPVFAGRQPNAVAQSAPEPETGPSVVTSDSTQRYPQSASANGGWSITKMLGIQDNEDAPPAAAAPQTQPAAAPPASRPAAAPRQQPQQTQQPARTNPELPGATPIRPANGGFSFTN